MIINTFNKQKAKLQAYKEKKVIEKAFDKVFYKVNYDLSIADDSLLDHFVEEGWKNGMDPCDWFSIADYLKQNADVAESGVNPFLHYLQYGRSEGRKASKSIKSHKISVSDKISDGYHKDAKQLLNSTKFNAKDWSAWLRKIPVLDSPHPSAKAFIEAFASLSEAKSGVLNGWVIHEPDTIVWVEDAVGTIFFLDDAFRYYRQDVCQAFPQDVAIAYHDMGFIIALRGIKQDRQIFLKALSSDGVHLLATKEVTIHLQSDTKKLADWLFSLDVPVSYLSKRFTKVDLPFIDTAIKQELNNFSCIVDSYGIASEDPEVSVIVPLYGRIDFIESQLLTFVLDDFFKQSVELIYVIDDPSLVVPMKTMASELFRLYQLPFKVVWGWVNRGFSGANNLGASQSNGNYLLFMNSDVFPIKSGWLEPLIDVLKQNSDVGVVAPKLLFADGSIQHAGIEFQYRSDLDIWINHHPQMGLDSKLDKYKALTFLPAVTGACLLVSREDFDSIEGWDTGYLIGDFEDSDFCLKLHDKGKKSAYLPTVELTHLERQSFGLTGQPDFKYKVVLLNATRHQIRWRHIINKYKGKETGGELE